MATTDRNGISITPQGWVSTPACVEFHPESRLLVPVQGGYRCRGCERLYSPGELRSLLEQHADEGAGQAASTGDAHDLDAMRAARAAAGRARAMQEEG